MKDRESVSNHVLRMQRYVDRLIKLNVNFDEELAIDIVLNSLPTCYDRFILTYHLNNNNETTLSQLHNLLRKAEARMKGKGIASPTSVLVLAIGQGKEKKRKCPPKQNWKGKSQVGSSSIEPKGKSSSDASRVSGPKETI
ncbi:hypothetical protein Lser_V15G14590 [Lactuca serriola]